MSGLSLGMVFFQFAIFDSKIRLPYVQYLLLQILPHASASVLYLMFTPISLHLFMYCSSDNIGHINTLLLLSSLSLLCWLCGFLVSSFWLPPSQCKFM